MWSPAETWKKVNDIKMKSSKIKIYTDYYRPDLYASRNKEPNKINSLINRSTCLTKLPITKKQTVTLSN